MTTTQQQRRPRTPDPAGPGPRRWVWITVATLFYVGLAALVAAKFLGAPAIALSPHLPGDQTWFEWLLAHGAYTLQHLSNPLFSAQQNAPDGVNMMANTSVLGVTLPLAPVTLLAGPRVTYVIWLMGALAATAATTAWVLRRHAGASPVGSLLGGAFAGFAPGVIHHANGQPNFVSNFLLPLIVAAALRLGRTGRWLRDGVLLGLLVTWQLFINEEMLLITALACAVAVLARWRKFWERGAGFLRGLGVTAAVAGVLCAYPIFFQFHGPGSFRGMPAFNKWGEDPVAYLTFSRDTLAGTSAAEAEIGHTEMNSWFGWPLTLLVIVLAIVAVRRRRSWGKPVAVLLGVFGILSLGPVLRLGGTLTTLPGPLAVLPEVAPLDMLMPARFTFVVVGVTAVLLAHGWDLLPPLWTAGARVATIAALVPIIPTPVPAGHRLPPPDFIASGAWQSYVTPGSTLVPLPLPDNGAGIDSLSWNATALHGFRVPEGYFLGPDASGAGHAGPVQLSATTQLISAASAAGVAPAVTDADRAAARADLCRWHASAVVVRSEPGYDLVRQLATGLYGPPELVRDVWLWRVPPTACPA
ncbi:hypothetical protein [Actinoplanes sp. TFC3]|uniref:hypothetical protein n=1 Tax=Actinoplanes sp. TFC3 TaxID=1710355 RepID=UPI00082AF28A|nr:hypothetical protein [Actinoplanes sp. TFC3]